MVKKRYSCHVASILYKMTSEVLRPLEINCVASLANKIKNDCKKTIEIT